jgi:hypothetical protein
MTTAHCAKRGHCGRARLAFGFGKASVEELEPFDVLCVVELTPR